MTCLLPLLIASLAMSSADSNKGFGSLSSIVKSTSSAVADKVPVPRTPSADNTSTKFNESLKKAAASSIAAMSPLNKAGDPLDGVKNFAKSASKALGDNDVTNNVSKIAESIGKDVEKEIAAVKQPVDTTIAFIGSSQCSNVKKIFGIAYEQLEGEKEPDLEKLTIEYRDPGIRTIYNISTAAQRIPLAHEFNARQKLYIFVHGFTDDPSGRSFTAIRTALLDKGNCNVLALDGSSLIHWLYLRSSTYVRFMGERLGEVLAAMVNKGIDPSQIHIIGHSLGAHISSFAGKTFSNLTGYNVGRLTGLDPAGPCFSHVDPDLRLKATDADYVDVIHTDAGVYGLRDAVGQVDYYPNNGQQQPECFLQTCSHSRAWEYFAESVTRPDAFPAVRCKDWDAFKKNKCDNKISYMGFPSEPGTTGLYYLQTGGESPYGIGKEGTRWKNNEGIIRTIGGEFFG